MIKKLLSKFENNVDLPLQYSTALYNVDSEAYLFDYIP